MSRESTSDQGSAYLAVLLVMFLLTTIALAFTFVTRTEKDIANFERSVQRVHFAAESGVHLSTTKYVLTKGSDVNAVSLDMRERGQDRSGDVAIDQSILVTPTVKVSEFACDGCQVNQGSSYVRVSNVLNSTADRVGAVNGEVLASRTISTFIDVQPLQADASGLQAALVRMDHNDEIKY